MRVKKHNENGSIDRNNGREGGGDKGSADDAERRNGRTVVPKEIERGGRDDGSAAIAEQHEHVTWDINVIGGGMNGREDDRRSEAKECRTSDRGGGGVIGERLRVRHEEAWKERANGRIRTAA